MKEVIMALPNQLGNVLLVDLFIAFCKQKQSSLSYVTFQENIEIRSRKTGGR